MNDALDTPGRPHEPHAILSVVTGWLQTLTAPRGMVTAPHHLAAEAGLSVLREGGNAIEAMVAAAATIAVVYPHMNSIGGDAFWLISEPGKPPVGIDACGRAARLATPAFYKTLNYETPAERFHQTVASID
jgi:gamma-glutamyltranspeptidase/glutathione hydrolase